MRGVVYLYISTPDLSIQDIFFPILHLLNSAIMAAISMPHQSEHEEPYPTERAESCEHLVDRNSCHILEGRIRSGCTYKITMTARRSYRTL